MVHEYTKNFVWESPEFVYREKKVDWFWWVGAIGVAAIVGAVLTKNYVFAVFLLIATVMVIIYARRKPDILTIELSDQGIKIGSDFIHYDVLDAFWVTNELTPDGNHLIIHSQSRRLPLDIITLTDEMNPVAIREFLVGRIPEYEMKEGYLQKFLHKIGF